MKAGQYIAQGKVGFLDVPDPTPEAGQVVVQLDKVAVCGSDVTELYYGDQFPAAPGRSGHECVAVVVQSDAPDYQVGDRVLVIPPDHNGWCQYLSVDPQWLVPVPDGLSMEEAVMAQLLGCVIWALKKVDNVYDQNVVVIGQGPAGMLFSNLLSNMGAKRVIGLDLEDYRLNLAQKLGASHTINANSDNIAAQVAEITGGQMADLVVEVAGKEETVDLAMDLGRKWADLLIFGIPKVSPLSFDMMKCIRQQQKLITTIGTQGEPGLSSFHLGMEMIASGRVDVRPFISHCLPFGQLGRGLDLAFKRTEEVVKVLIEIDK